MSRGSHTQFTLSFKHLKHCPCNTRIESWTLLCTLLSQVDWMLDSIFQRSLAVSVRFSSGRYSVINDSQKRIVGTEGWWWMIHEILWLGTQKSVRCCKRFAYMTVGTTYTYLKDAEKVAKKVARKVVTKVANGRKYRGFCMSPQSHRRNIITNAN